MRRPTTKWHSRRDRSRHLTATEVRTAHRLMTMATWLEATSTGVVRDIAGEAREGFSRALLRSAGVA